MAEIFIDELLRMLSIGFNPIIIMFISSSLRIFNNTTITPNIANQKVKALIIFFNVPPPKMSN